MKIFIIGAGAIGKTLAGFLKHTGKDVILLRGHVDNQAPYIEKIEIEMNNGTVIANEVTVSTIANYSTLDGIIVITTKSYGNRKIAESLKGKTGNAPIVVMQNGLGVEKPFLAHDYPEIYRCVLFTSCQYVDNHLRFKPAADSLIGVIRGSEAKLQAIVESLHNPYLSFLAEKEIQPVIWTKAIINSAFNSICPLLETDNGIFHRDEKALQLAKEVIRECMAIAEKEGIVLNADKVLERLLHISKTSDGQLISTYQDLLHKRETEIETLNLAIAEKAEEIHQGGMVKTTQLLGALVKLKSELFRKPVALEPADKSIS